MNLNEFVLHFRQKIKCHAAQTNAKKSIHERIDLLDFWCTNRDNILMVLHGNINVIDLHNDTNRMTRNNKELDI